MKNVKELLVKVAGSWLILGVVMLGSINTVRAEEEPIEEVESVTVALTIRSGDVIIFENEIELQAEGSMDINGQPVNTQSVLSVIRDADSLDDSWEISNLEYFDSFGAFYLKCLDSATGNDCENWQFVVDGTSPFSSIDQTDLDGGENIYLYFGPQNRITLSDDSITTTESVLVTVENYDYENNDWSTRNGVTVGLTQPNLSDPFNPTEITTEVVNSDGQATFSNIAAGSYNIGVKEDYYFPTQALTVTSAPSPNSTSGGGGSSNTKKKNPLVLGATTTLKFDLKKAFDFLISNQKENGSFGEKLYTDWAALAMASGNYQKETIKLVKHFSETKAQAEGNLTDHERHAMGLLAMGLNPYNTNGENYIAKITSTFDGKQFGDINENNDDIFALIVLQNTGFTIEDEMVKNSIDFLLSKQKENGSWNENIDMTGAAISALVVSAPKSCFPLGSLSPLASGALPLDPSICETPQNKELFGALKNAKEFLKKNQKADGGFGNVSSTAWAIEGITSLGEKLEDWKKEESTPFDYLATMQDVDGGIKNLSAQTSENLDSRIWETSYVISAFDGKTWNELMQKFDKPKDFKDVLGVSTENKTVAKVAPKKVIKKEVQIQKEISLPANVIEAPENPKPAPETESWFMKFINFIF